MRLMNFLPFHHIQEIWQQSLEHFQENDIGKGDRIYILGKYSTEEKAMKAMEMCRKHYATAEYNRRIIPKGDTLVDMEIAKELLSSGFIFQFPADDEI